MVQRRCSQCRGAGQQVQTMCGADQQILMCRDIEVQRCSSEVVK
jgi:hypothetical protein